MSMKMSWDCLKMTMRKFSNSKHYKMGHFSQYVTKPCITGLGHGKYGAAGSGYGGVVF